MAKKDGKLLVLQFDDVTLVGQTSGSLSFTSDTLDITTKDSVKFKEFLAGEANATLSASGLYDPEAAEGVSEAFANIVAGTALKWTFGEITAGSTAWTGNGILTSLQIQADKNSPVTYAVEFQNSGTPTETVMTGS